jgi:hypothetical protein
MSKDKFKVRDRRGDNRYFIDNAFLKQWGGKLGPHCIAVYSALAMYSDADDQTSYPSFQTIADLTGMSRRQVVREIEKLKANNIIKVEERKEVSGESGNKFFLSNIFTLLHPDVWKKDNLSIHEPSDSESLPLVTGSHQPSDSLSLPLVTQSHLNNTNKNNTQVTRGKAPPDSLDDFSWQAVVIYTEIVGLKLDEIQGKAIIQLVEKSPNFDFDRWRLACTTTKLAGVLPANIACRIETYKAGGDYQVMKATQRNGYPPANKSSPAKSLAPEKEQRYQELLAARQKE